MRLIVDLNPYLERSITIDKFDSQKDVIAKNFNLSINKNVINVFRIFNLFGIDSILMTILGGYNGEVYEKLLDNEGINHNKIAIRDEILERISISSEQRKLAIISEEPRITMEEVNELYSSFSNNINPKDFVIVVENSETERTLEFIENIINISYRRSTRIGVVANTFNIGDVIKAKPYLIILGIEELEKYSNQELNFDWEVSKVCKGIIESGVANLLLVKSNNELQLYNGKEILKAIINQDEENTIEKNNAISGYVAGLTKGYDDNMALSIALAVAKIKSPEHIGRFDTANMKMMLKEIKVDKFNA